MNKKKITNEEIMKELQELKKKLEEKQLVTIINVPAQEVKPITPSYPYGYYPWWLTRPYYISNDGTTTFTQTHNVYQVLC